MSAKRWKLGARTGDAVIRQDIELVEYPVIVASVYGATTPLADSYEGASKLVENANLMAAAPELLEALEEAEQALAGSYDVTEWPATPDCMANVALKSVRAAIAKAKGTL